MSCWVVPSIAAEMWGVSIEQVLDGMSAGHIPSKSESGFTFVDVAPNSPKIKAPKALVPTPPTYTVVSAEELEALQCEDGEDQTMNLGDWREARENSKQLRRRPLAA